MTKAANSAVQIRPVINGRRWSHLTGAASPTMTLVSRGLPVYASSTNGVDVAANAVDSDYNTKWIAGAMPATLAIDISSVTIATQSDGWKPMLFSWLTDCVDFSQGVSGQNISIAPGTYTIEGNTAAGGGAAPGSGWTTLKTVTSSAVASRADIINVAGGINWVRINVTGDAQGGSTPPQIQVDLWNCSGATISSNTKLDCGWMTVGDSITAFGLALRKPDQSNARNSLGDQVFTAIGARPFQIDSGHEGYKAGDLSSLMTGYLSVFPGKYVTLNFGTNESIGSVSAATYKTNMLARIAEIQAAGKIAVIPTIPWLGTAQSANVPPLNTAIAEILAADSTVLAGPDLYAYFNANQAQITGNDNIHPTPAGYVNLMTLWVNRVQAIGNGS